ncbi:hypothetical protein AAFF_G00329660 [Aldrovandia affinis]|uniref:Uncharacterized protein n=1 Tax=Aldrovandia affinis TaxID=143900 RepID=A0AAD7WQ96_9TELE|nr:hypothetical protein AAFF_G00329660 [Aldrovandia affinis]
MMLRRDLRRGRGGWWGMFALREGEVLSGHSCSRMWAGRKDAYEATLSTARPLSTHALNSPLYLSRRCELRFGTDDGFAHGRCLTLEEVEGWGGADRLPREP